VDHRYRQIGLPVKLKRIFATFSSDSARFVDFKFPNRIPRHGEPTEGRRHRGKAFEPGEAKYTYRIGFLGFKRSG
jgi:hypothetical protein